MISIFPSNLADVCDLSVVLVVDWCAFRARFHQLKDFWCSVSLVLYCKWFVDNIWSLVVLEVCARLSLEWFWTGVFLGLCGFLVWDVTSRLFCHPAVRRGWHGSVKCCVPAGLLSHPRLTFCPCLRSGRSFFLHGGEKDSQEHVRVHRHAETHAISMWHVSNRHIPHDAAVHRDV